MITYGTLVKVIAGFYIGCVGTIQSHNTSGDYRVKLQCRNGLGEVTEESEDLSSHSIKKVTIDEYNAVIYKDTLTPTETPSENPSK